MNEVAARVWELRLLAATLRGGLSIARMFAGIVEVIGQALLVWLGETFRLSAQPMWCGRWRLASKVLPDEQRQHGTYGWQHDLEEWCPGAEGLSPLSDSLGTGRGDAFFLHGANVRAAPLCLSLSVFQSAG